jgi:hypothetical protein
MTGDHGMSLVVVTITSSLFPRSEFVTIVKRLMSPVDPELLILPEHLSSPPISVGFVLLNMEVFCVLFC